MEYDRLMLSENRGLLKKLLSEGAELLFAPKGYSMMPTINNSGDSVILIKPDNIKKYDIALYERDGGQLVMHRAVGVDGNSFNMCGDNQWVVEKGIEKGQIIAIVSKINRKGRVIECDGFIYGLYSRLWVFAMPLRHILIGGFRRIKRTFGK